MGKTLVATLLVFLCTCATFADQGTYLTDAGAWLGREGRLRLGLPLAGKPGLSRREVIKALGHPHRSANKSNLLLRAQPDQPQIYIFDGFARKALKLPGVSEWLIYFDASKESMFLVGLDRKGTLVFAKESSDR